MANIDYPRGLLSPSPYTAQVATRTFLASGTVYRGDPCRYGTTNSASTPDTAGHVIACATGAVTNFDVVALHYAATGDPVVCCVNPHEVSFEAQTDDATIVTAAMGCTCDLIQAAGDSVRKTSGAEIDSSTIEASLPNSGCVRIVDVVDRADNDPALTNRALRVVKLQIAIATGDAGTPPAI